MKVIETRRRVKGFVLWGHCQNLLDDPRIDTISMELSILYFMGLLVWISIK